MSWKSFLKDYLHFSRYERYGIVGLCVAVVLLLIIKTLLPCFIKSGSVDVSAYEKDITAFRRAVDSVQLLRAQAEVLPDAFRPESSLFYFDPNHITDKEWEKLGLNARQIRNIRNYLARGGYFSKKEDLQKIYTLPVAQYKILEPYILIRKKSSPAKVTKESEQPEHIPDESPAPVIPEKSSLLVELNTADSSLLVQLPGIGPVLASRILRYRNLIGGFADISQLTEVYGIKPETVNRMASQLSTDSTFIRKIRINHATFRDLVRHPYLNEQQVHGILKYLKLQERIHQPEELVRNHILTQEDMRRLMPYLSFD